MGLTSFLFFQCKTAFNVNTCHVISDTSQLLPPVRRWPSGNRKLLFCLLGNFGQALCIKSCHEDLILTRISHNYAGIGFIQEGSAGGSKLSEQTLQETAIFGPKASLKEVPFLLFWWETYPQTPPPPPEFLPICKYNSWKKLHVTDLSKMDIL